MLRPGTSLQSRIAVFGSGDDTGVSGASRLEAYIVQALGPDIHVRFSGPALGLDLLF